MDIFEAYEKYTKDHPVIVKTKEEKLFDLPEENEKAEEKAADKPVNKFSIKDLSEDDKKELFTQLKDFMKETSTPEGGEE